MPDLPASPPSAFAPVRSDSQLSTLQVTYQQCGAQCRIGEFSYSDKFTIHGMK